MSVTLVLKLACSSRSMSAQAAARRKEKALCRWCSLAATCAATMHRQVRPSHGIRHCACSTDILCALIAELKPDLYRLHD